ncbi:DUF4381 domain-containing protein [Xanthobacter sp. TB0136]|uniref:DUF4381 domain-containing protein n=1 Tax=Xanthobacter sp. TB0136 TaxID=3459177 RepID=UPI0040391630
MAQELKLPQAPVPLSLEGDHDPLAQLRDIHLPPDVPFWPPAPGWIALAGLVLLVVLILGIREWLWRRTLAYKALKALDAAEGHDSRASAAASAELIRRILVSRKRTREATLTGSAWVAFLGAGKHGLAPHLAELVASAPYLPPRTPEAAGKDDAALRNELLKAVRRWIRANA